MLQAVVTMDLIFLQSASEMSFIYRRDECQKVRVASQTKKEESQLSAQLFKSLWEYLRLVCEKISLSLSTQKRKCASGTREGNLHNIKGSSLKKT